MIDSIVRYLHDARVPFRLASYPSAEPLPRAVHSIPKGGMRVDTSILLVDGRPVLAMFPVGEKLDLAAVSSALGRTAVQGRPVDLPGELRNAEGTIPPLGHLYGFPLIADERIPRATSLVFLAFGESTYFEISYEDFARLEQPRIAAIAFGGELPASAARRAG